MADKELSKYGITKYLVTKIARKAVRTYIKILWLGRKDFHKSEIKSILFIQLYGIGDYLMSTPAIEAIAKEFPKAKKTVLCNEASTDIAKNTPSINQVIILNNLKNNPKKFDLVVSLNDSAKASLTALKLKPKYLLGFLKGNKVTANFKINSKTANSSNKWVENYLLIPKAIGIDYKEQNYKVKIKKFKWIDRLIKSKKLKKFVIINPNTREGAEAKNWGNENYFNLSVKLLEQGYQIVLCGAKNEKNSVSIAKNLIKSPKNSNKVLDLTGKTSLSEALYLFSKSKLFIGNDTGLMHIALASNCPTIGLFGPTNSKILFQNKNNSKALQINNQKWPCYTKGTFDIKPRQDYMDQITVEKVMDTVIYLSKKN
ncbi:MAG: glycosyltransferase family 9 protein [Candidatus Diapherotrites archaeon]|nr:glycosyltransferase family 9 protein [Candidatus Diapherotrites archaeon]